jgi:hypothetical protein
MILFGPLSFTTCSEAVETFVRSFLAKNQFLGKLTLAFLRDAGEWVSKHSVAALNATSRRY